VKFHKDEDCAGCHLIECQSCKTLFDLAAKADPYNQSDSMNELQGGIAYLWNLRAQSATEPVQGEAVEYQQLSRYNNWDRIDKEVYDLGKLGQSPERFRALYTAAAKPDAEMVELLRDLSAGVRVLKATMRAAGLGMGVDAAKALSNRIDAKLASLK